MRSVNFCTAACARLTRLRTDNNTLPPMREITSAARKRSSVFWPVTGSEPGNVVSSSVPAGAPTDGGGVVAGNTVSWSVGDVVVVTTGAVVVVAGAVVVEPATVVVVPTMVVVVDGRVVEVVLVVDVVLEVVLVVDVVLVVATTAPLLMDRSWLPTLQLSSEHMKSMTRM